MTASKGSTGWKFFDAVTAMLAMAYLTSSVRQDFGDFGAANPDSGLADYLVERGLPALPWVLGTIGVIALIGWLTRPKGGEPLVLAQSRPLRTLWLIFLPALAAGVVIGSQNWLPALALTITFWLIVIVRLGIARPDDPVARQELRTR